ncbi:MAG TPA: TlpA disulfide reductase family protein [Anaeromyxobacteraceae bacterium]|nr:TlpA disulfide reductase family protein [Anaeromyxobacteraceae bacterium]
MRSDTQKDGGPGPGASAGGELGTPPRTARRVAVAVVLLAVLGGLSWGGSKIFGKDVGRSDDAFEITHLAPPLAAPPLSALAVDGKPFTLADAKGQVLFLNFWATWCPPCREEMPSMLQLGRELSERYPGKFRMVAVSVDEGWDAVRQFFLGRLPSGVHVVLDPNQQVTKDYYCAARHGRCDEFKFPETYIVDATGKLVAYVVGPRDWNDPAAARFLEKLLR